MLRLLSPGRIDKVRDRHRQQGPLLPLAVDSVNNKRLGHLRGCQQAHGNDKQCNQR